MLEVLQWWVLLVRIPGRQELGIRSYTRVVSVERQKVIFSDSVGFLVEMSVEVAC